MLFLSLFYGCKDLPLLPGLLKSNYLDIFKENFLKFSDDESDELKNVGWVLKVIIQFLIY